MPDQPLPPVPDFGFFTERPHIIIDRDNGDEANLDRYPTDEANPVRAVSLVYPTRQDYELDEIERLRENRDYWQRMFEQLFRDTSRDEELMNKYQAKLDAGIQYTLAAIKKVPPYEPGDDFLPPDVVRGTFIRILEMLTTDDAPYKQVSQLDAARQALAEVYESVPVFMQERLDKLRAMLERE